MPDEPVMLPAVPEDAAVEEMVFDGEVVGDDGRVPARAAVPAVPAAARPAARFAARHAALVVVGAVVAYRRRQQGRTLAQRMARELAERGEHDKALALLVHEQDARHRRHERWQQRAATLVMLVKASPWIVAATAGGMLALGIASGDAAWPFHVAADLARAVRIAVTWGFRIGVIAVPLGALAWLHEAGRRAGSLTPGWAIASGDPGADVSIDEATVTRAIAALRLPQVTDYLKRGPLPYLVPCRQEGRGTYCEIRLPAGVTAERVARRRADLASGLFRLAKEVWPGTGAEAAILTLWVADKGALAEGAGPYPLLEDGSCDVFKGVPFGRTLRGDPVLAPLMERNTLTGGMPGQGKSSSARVIMCGAALDPTAELWVLVPDTNFDFERMKRRCSRYVMGAEDERVEVIRDWLSDLRDEVQARGQLLIDHGVPAVTRKLASAGVGLHPLVVLLEEAHLAITHHQYGKEISGLLVDVVKLGRKRGIHVIVSTQAPTKDSMPRDVTRNCSNGVAFAVGDHVANDALLGQGAYAGGHRATELIPGTDRGTALVKGFSGERSEMVQVYFLDVADGHDQVTPIVERSLAEIARLGRGLPGGTVPLTAIEARDLLADVEAVIDGPWRVGVNDLPGRLRALAPSWRPYAKLTGRQLRDLLSAEGVKTTNTDNRPALDPADLREAIARREGMSELP